MDDVEYFGYREEHPLTGLITVVMKVRSGSSSPRELVKRAIKELDGYLDGLLDEVDRL
jgi:DNA-directed RNA polymerase subunit L